MRSRDWAACALLVLLAGTARAAEDGIYIGAAYGETQTQHKIGLSNVYDDEDSSYKLIAGWRPFDWFALEASYYDLGEVTLERPVPDLSPFRLEQDGYNVFSVFLIELASFDLFAKAGVVQSSADLTTGTIAGPTSSVDHDTDFAWGAGAQVRFRKLALRLEYERFEISNGDSFEPPQNVSFGITWTF